MRRYLVGLFVLLFAVAAQAAPGQGYTKQIVSDNGTVPAKSVWAPVWNIFDDTFSNRVVAEVVISAVRAVNDSTGKLVGLHTDASGNLKVVVTGASGTSVTGPLGTRTGAQSVSIVPPTDTRFQISANAAANAAGNPLQVQLGDGTYARKPPWGPGQDDYVGGEVALNIVAQNFVLPVTGVQFCMRAQGGAACVVCGAGAPPTVNMSTDCTYNIPEGGEVCDVLTGPNCGVISPSTVAGGYLRFRYKKNAAG